MTTSAFAPNHVDQHGAPWTPAGGAALQPRGLIVTVEGIWGAGKSTLARTLDARLQELGFSSCVLHYGPRHGVQQPLTWLLDEHPLRSRTGLGGYPAPHHATVDVLMRLCREADNQRYYREAARTHQVVLVGHGIYAKLAYYLTVLREQHPHTPADELLDQLRACVDLWWLHPDLALHLDIPWPLARERAISRGRGGGDPASVERLLFLPSYDLSYQHILAAHPAPVRRVRTGTRTATDIADEALDHIRRRLRVPDTGPLIHQEADRDGR